MTGYHSATVIAEAVSKGLPGSMCPVLPCDEEEAMQSDIRALPLYREYGYIPCELYRQSVSTDTGLCLQRLGSCLYCNAAGPRTIPSSQGTVAYV